jgi:hypothetical protein
MEETRLTAIPQWTVQEECLLASWAERASGYRWLHDQSAKYYDYLNRFLEIPVSILSYLSGGAILSGNLADSNSRYIVGAVSILGGILTNVQTGLRWKELSAKHRLVGNLFSAYYRNITAELALEPKYRVHPLEYLRLKRNDFDRLIEQSPMVPQNIIHEFNLKFKDLKISKPDITNGLHPVTVYRRSKEFTTLTINESPQVQTYEAAPPSPQKINT